MNFRCLLLLFSFMIIIGDVWAQEKLTTLEEFVASINSSLIVRIQENPQFLREVVSDLMLDAKAFLLSNFGYNRLVLAKKTNESLAKIWKLPQSTNTRPEHKLCISRNKNIMFFLVREATFDWNCLESQVFATYDAVKATLNKLLRIKDVPGSECSLGVLCFVTKGFSGITLGASLSANLLDLGLTLTDFFSAVRRCQKKVTPLDEAFEICLNNMKLCFDMIK